MIRTFMTDKGLEFVYDHTTSHYPFTNMTTSVLKDNKVDAVIVSNPITPLPSTVIRTNPSVTDVNDDPELRKRMTKYFFHKFKNDWLYQSFIDLQKYLEVKDGHVQFVKSIDEYKKDETSEDKIRFIHEEVFTRSEMLKFLDKYVRRYNVNWYDLKTKHKYDVQDRLQSKLKNHMKKLVIEKL